MISIIFTSKYVVKHVVDRIYVKLFLVLVGWNGHIKNCLTEIKLQNKYIIKIHFIISNKRAQKSVGEEHC